MTPSATRIDRAAAVRRALLTLVARHGLHGASMSAVAKEAGVATGTAYVHYESKEALLFATYLELKRDMGRVVQERVDQTAGPHDRVIQLWFVIHGFLAEDADRARFMVQVESSPYAAAAHEMAMATDGDPIMAQATAPDLAEHLAPLPIEVLYDLGIGPAIRLAAAGAVVDTATLTTVAEACWRAITLA